MPDETPSSKSPPASKPASKTVPAGPTIHIGDEFGTAKRNLPPVKILLLATAGVLIIAGIYSFFQRAKPQAAGSLHNVTAGGLPGQSAVLVTLPLTLCTSPPESLRLPRLER